MHTDRFPVLRLLASPSFPPSQPTHAKTRSFHIFKPGTDPDRHQLSAFCRSTCIIPASNLHTITSHLHCSHAKTRVALRPHTPLAHISESSWRWTSTGSSKNPLGRSTSSRRLLPSLNISERHLSMRQYPSINTTSSTGRDSQGVRQLSNTYRFNTISDLYTSLSAP